MDARFAWLIFAPAALMATLSATELVRFLAHRLNAVDHPGGRRMHRIPTARLGGLGIFWGFSLALIAGFTIAAVRGELPAGGPHLSGLMFAGALVVMVGLVDDVRGVRAWKKLVFQVAAGGVLWSAGWRVESVGLPGFGAVDVAALSLPLTVAWVVLVTNALNLIDGLDGLACGAGIVTAIAATAFLAPGGAAHAIAVALVGALAGFLWFNLHPALIFMGDAGSLLTGVLVSAVTLEVGNAAGSGAFPLIPALLVAVPLLDLADAVVRRGRGARGSGFGYLKDFARRIAVADGMHIHHRLRRAGFGVRAAAGLLWLAAIAWGAAAVLLERRPEAGAALVLALAAGTAFALRRLDRRVAERLDRPAGGAARPPLVAPGMGVVRARPMATREPVETAETGRRAA